jgi:hypothetical protein
MLALAAATIKQEDCHAKRRKHLPEVLIEGEIS